MTSLHAFHINVLYLICHINQRTLFETCVGWLAIVKANFLLKYPIKRFKSLQMYGKALRRYDILHANDICS